MPTGGKIKQRILLGHSKSCRWKQNHIDPIIVGNSASEIKKAPPHSSVFLYTYKGGHSTPKNASAKSMSSPTEKNDSLQQSIPIFIFFDYFLLD